MKPDEHALQILITSGDDAPERAVLGFACALAAVHNELRASVVLAMKGAMWAAPSQGNEAKVPGYPAVGELIRELRDAGGEVFGCSSCIDQYCPAQVGPDGLKMLREEIERVGFSVVTLRMADPGIRTITF